MLATRRGLVTVVVVVVILLLLSFIVVIVIIIFCCYCYIVLRLVDLLKTAIDSLTKPAVGEEEKLRL